MRLTIHDHDRSSAGMTYVYPVVSRRAGGVSIGVNLNPNAACNWRCVYCQVPGLARGAGPPIDLPRLERELGELLDLALDPAWMQRRVPEGARRLNDVAFSGDGEPTSSPQLVEAVGLAAAALARRELLGELRLVLITNGSLVHKPRVQEALRALAAAGGEVWFKVDSATAAGRAATNDTRGSPARARANLELAARLCPTWVQTMALARAGRGPNLAGAELDAYCELLRQVRASGAPLRGVLLYGLARPSHQPEAPSLAPLPEEELRALGERIAAATGLEVRVSP